MYCERGYYNTTKNYCQFWQKPYILNKKGDSLSGDHIYYDREKDYGQILDNFSLVDTTDNIILKGDYAEYNGSNETILATCRALLLQVYNKDTLHLHGDTLFGKNISMTDTGKNSKPKLMLAYHHVKFFKKDMAGKCDSLTYDEKDSIMHMFYNPILWSDVNQLTADSMKLHFKNKKMDVLDMRGHAFIASKDTLAYKLVTADSIANAQLHPKDSVGSDSLVKDSTPHLQRDTLVKDNSFHLRFDTLAKDSAHSNYESFAKDTNFHLQHDTLANDSSHSHHDSLVMHKKKGIHGSDTMQFNQIKGKNMKGYFRDNKMFKVNVTGNAQTIYYVYSDNNTSELGANRTNCSNMIIFIVNNKINSITFLQKPDGTLFPMKDVKPITDFLLGGFHWYDKDRPRSIPDVFKGSEN